MKVFIDNGGDIFDSSAQVIINPVNTVGVMGKGLAASFKSRYPEMFTAYQVACKRHECTVGQPFYWEEFPQRIICNFPTKISWKMDSKLEYIQEGLNNLHDYILAHHISSIAFPKIGSGLGGLDWNTVKSMILLALSDVSDLEVTLYQHSRDGLDSITVAIIGTRNPNPAQYQRAKEAAGYCLSRGFYLRTGNADGVDGISRDVFNQLHPERVTLCLPWKSYNQNKIHPLNHVELMSINNEAAMESLKLHPLFYSLKSSTKLLHARNYNIVFPCQAVLAAPSDTLNGGGTGQGMRVAEHYGIPLFDLNKEEDIQRFMNEF